jgi:hypothetical protein
MPRSRFISALPILLVPLGMVACSLPGLGSSLDEETLNRLRFSMDENIQMQPGESRDLTIGTMECCYVFEPVEAKVTWSVQPTEGATIDPQTGLLTIDPSVASGAVFTVSADVENGRRVVSGEVHVYTPEANPLVGLWREEVQFACGSGEEIVPEERIGELEFEADGTFSVTWHPFEIYHDYWGTYSYDLEAGTLDLVASGGNYIPTDLVGTGSFVIDEEGRLILSEIWLGSPRGQENQFNCGHRFARPG